jgi:hypothetical protein
MIFISFISRIIIILLLLWHFLAAKDSTKVQYAIVGMSFYGDHDVVKIKVPPWLLTSELMEQIKLSILGPSSSFPLKKTYIYVFSETDQVGDISSTGAVYIPGKGFLWSLSEWTSKDLPDATPSEKDLEIYYILIDRIVKDGSTLDNLEIRKQVAEEYSMSISQLDSIYSWVKYWVSLQQDKIK